MRKFGLTQVSNTEMTMSEMNSEQISQGPSCRVGCVLVSIDDSFPRHGSFDVPGRCPCIRVESSHIS